MGGWPSSEPLKKLNDQGAEFILGIPYGAQNREAEKCYDPSAAKEYLYAHRRSPEVKAVLKAAWDGGPHQLGGDKSRFPGLRRFIAVLMRKGLATDRNFELLFGDASAIRRTAQRRTLVHHGPLPLLANCHAHAGCGA